MIKWIIDSHCTCSIRYCPSSPETSLTDVRMVRCQRDKKRAKLAAYGTSDKCAPHWSAELQRVGTMHQDTAMVPSSQTAMKKKKVQSQIASDKEGMSSRAIHRHSACGEVLKKKKIWPKAEAFVFIQKSQAAVLWIHHWKNLPGFWLLPCDYNQQMVIISQAGASGQLLAKHK